MNIASFRITIKLLLWVLLLAVATLWTYWGSLENGFVWDSIEYVINHFFWISSLSTDNIIWMFLSLEVANWHPLTWISWALDYEIFGGLTAWGFHLSSNILHTVNSVLIFFLTLVLFGLNQPATSGFPFRSDNNALIAAFLAALLFAIHPQHVESVAWIAERKDLLFMFFLLLSTFAYVRYVTGVDRAKNRWFNTTLLLYLLALLSKPMAVTFPVVLLLLDFYPLRRTQFTAPGNHFIRQQSIYKLVREKLPFFLLSIALILITLFAQQEALSSRPFHLKLLNAFNSIIFYLTQLSVPLNFSPLYPYFVEIDESITWKALVPLLAALGITVAALIAWAKGRHAWLVAWLFYLVTLSPVLGLIQVGQQGSADRYAYLPTLPVYLFVGAGVLLILNNATLRKKAILFLAILPVIFFLSDKTRQQIQVWKSPQSLWAHAVKYNPENVGARHNLGIAHLNQEEYEEAAFYFGENVNSRTKPVVSLAWRALSYLYLDRFEDALADYSKLSESTEPLTEVNLDPNCVYYNSAWAYAKSGMFIKSRDFFDKVNKDSKLGASAADWINWLESDDPEKGPPETNEDLPGFCTKLFRSRAEYYGEG